MYKTFYTLFCKKSAQLYIFRWMEEIFSKNDAMRGLHSACLTHSYRYLYPYAIPTLTFFFFFFYIHSIFTFIIFFFNITVILWGSIIVALFFVDIFWDNSGMPYELTIVPLQTHIYAHRYMRICMCVLN